MVGLKAVSSCAPGTLPTVPPPPTAGVLTELLLHHPCPSGPSCPSGLLPPGAPAGRRTGRPLRGGGLNELVCTPSCPAGRRLAQGLGDGCRAVLGGPGCAPPTPLQRQLRASELQACRSRWQREAQVSPGPQWVAGPWAGGGPLVRHPAVGGPGMAEAGGWKAEPPTRSPSPPGCTGPGHVLDSSTRWPGIPSWTCCQLGKRGPHRVMAQLLCLRREEGWAGGVCGRRAVPGARSRSLTMFIVSNTSSHPFRLYGN